MPNDSRVRKAGVGVVRTTMLIVATVLIAAGVLAPATAAASPASTSVSASTTSQHLAPSTEPGVQSRCLVWRRTTANYQGLTAGYSWAWNVVIAYGDSGDRVREIQCLLDWWGYYVNPLTGAPGPLDGVYGGLTKSAVERIQYNECGIDPDGIVGPETWRCIRDGGEV
jgi:hypothetical protein